MVSIFFNCYVPVPIKSLRLSLFNVFPLHVCWLICFLLYMLSSVFLEGPEGVNGELGFACFCTWKMGFWSLGLGFESEKKAKMGM